MTSALISKLDVTDQIVGKLKVTVTMRRSFAWRLKLAGLLISLASHVSPIEVEVTNPEASQ
jgi:hypothetical protein